jgi:hypothetical protein
MIGAIVVLAYVFVLRLISLAGSWTDVPLRIAAAISALFLAGTLIKDVAQNIPATLGAGSMTMNPIEEEMRSAVKRNYIISMILSVLGRLLAIYLLVVWFVL